AVADLAHLHRALANAVAAEPERAVETEEPVLGQHAADREVAPGLPVAGNAQRQQHRVVAEGSYPERLLAEAGPVAGRELAVATVRHRGEPGAAQRRCVGDACFAAPQFGAEQVDSGAAFA